MKLSDWTSQRIRSVVRTPVSRSPNRAARIPSLLELSQVADRRRRWRHSSGDHIGHGPFDRRGQFAPNRRRYDAIRSDIQHGYCRFEAGQASPGGREGAEGEDANLIKAPAQFRASSTRSRSFPKGSKAVPSCLTLLRTLGYASTV